MGDGALGRRGVEGEVPAKRHLGPDPHLGLLDIVEDSWIATLIAWYKPRIPGFPLNRQGKEQVVFLGDGPGVPKMSLALEQPQTCTGATLGLL